MGGVWNTSSPPERSGAYFNFSAALTAAVASGVVGRTAVVGTADWGPVGLARQVTSQGEYEAAYGISTNGTLRDAALGALDGVDGNGAGSVLAYRAAGSAKANSAVTLNDGSAVAALVVTAKYPGTRGNNFTVTVQTNGSNKDLILYESGVELERWENVTSGNNDAFVTAINTTAPSKYITVATTGSAPRALVNVSASPLIGGNSGLTLVAGDYTAALGVMAQQDFDTIALANTTDDTILDSFAGWLRDRNEEGKRSFGVIGGLAAETLVTAQARSTEYDGAGTYRATAQNLINLGATDLRRLSDDRVFSTAELAPRVAGAVAAIGFSRSLTHMTLTGYQVNSPLTPANYTAAQQTGVLTFTNDTTERVFISSQTTALKSTNTTDRPAGARKIRTVAICHFIENTLSRIAGDLYLGGLANDATGRNDLVGSFVRFLRDLETQRVLEPGTTEVQLDDRFVQTGDAVYLAYKITPVGTVERIFSSVQVG